MRAPAWVLLFVFLPLQIFLFVKILGEWGFWRSAGAMLLLGLVATRAARARGLRAILFPQYAERWEQRRHIFQGILFVGAVVLWVAKFGPQPWLPLAVGLSAIKAGVQ